MDQKVPACGCEACEFSTIGSVQPGEVLIRLVLSPRHYKKGRLKSAVLSHAEDMGLSAFRDGHTADADLLATATSLVGRARVVDAKAGLVGVLLMKASDVKSERAEEAGAVVYCIYDYPDMDIDAHAEVYQTVAEATDDLKQARKEWLFTKVVSTFVNADDFRGGLLSGLKPPA